MERITEVNNALHELEYYPSYKAVIKVKNLARAEKKDGNDEYAETLMAMAQRAERKLDWAYDEAIDNLLV